MSRGAIALLRVSSVAQADENRHGLPAQREECKRIADSSGLRIVDWVELEGVSGTAVLRDPRYVRLLDRIANPEIVAVVTADFDRLFRRERFGDFQILDKFSETGTLICTSSGEINLAHEFGGIFSLLRGEMAGIEGRLIAERTRRGREKKRRQGLKAEGGGLPLGIHFDHDVGRWSYVFPEANRVRKVFALWLQHDGGLPFAEIARQVGLGSGGSSNRSWRVRSILEHPLYKGVQRVDRHWVRVRDPLTGKVRVRGEPRSAHEVYENVVLDPLVSPEDWERAQQLLKLRKPKRPPRRNPDEQEGTYPGLLECAECSAHLWVQPSAVKTTSRGTSPQSAAYLCPNSRREGCATGSTSQALADPIIDEALELRLGNRATLERLIHEAAIEAQRRASAPMVGLQRRLHELAGRRARVQEGYERGLYEADEAAKKLGEVEDQRAEIEALMATEERAPEIAPELVTALVDVFGHFRDLAREEKRQLLRDFRVRVRVSKVPGPGRRRLLQVDSIRLGLFHDNAVIYK